MGVGYIFGCLMSIILWKLDRQVCFIYINNFIKRYMKKGILIEFTYILIITAVCFILYRIQNSEVFNAITSFLVIDISNTERKNLRLKDKIHFYDSISTISRSVVCGFTAPLIYLLFFNNPCAIAYMLMYNITLILEKPLIIRALFTAMSIIPCIVSQIFLYIVYVIRNKKLIVDFKGDYFENCIIRPLLNVDILAAFIEKVNFYSYYNDKGTHYIKSYGDYTKKIDSMCIKDYLSIAYSICLLFFAMFLFFVILFKKY